MKFFRYINNEIVLNQEEILLVKEFSDLMELKRNKCKNDLTGKNRLRAWKEFKFMYLFFDWESPYFQFIEKEKYEESQADSELTDLEMEDVTFKKACKKYDELQNSSKIAKLLKASYNTIDKITHYLNNIDLNERDEITGKPIWKTKDVIAEISSVSKLNDAIKTLEVQFKRELEPDAILRGDASPGLFD